MREAEKTSEDNRPSQFFDLKIYFKSKIQEFDKQAKKANKKVRFGDKSEYKERLSINWQNEFQSFIDADINRWAWVDKFAVDTIPSEKGYTVLHQSKSATIPIKYLEVSFSESDKQVNSITVKIERNSLLYKSKQTLTFKPDISYTVNGWQRTMLLAKTEFEVKGLIVE